MVVDRTYEEEEERPGDEEPLVQGVMESQAVGEQPGGEQGSGNPEQDLPQAVQPDGRAWDQEGDGLQ